MSTIDDTLRTAAGRLLAGEPLRTDGALTINNLAREARVARATVYRSPVIHEFRQAILDHQAHNGSPATLHDEIHRLRTELDQLRRRHAQQLRELKADTSGLQQLVQVLTLERDALLRQANHLTPIDELHTRRS